MTKEWAEKILASPKFGDPDCIAAVERLAQEPEIQRLRKLVIGKYIVCGPCGGRPIAGECSVCKDTGRMLITQQWAETWDLDILQEVHEEISGERSDL